MANYGDNKAFSINPSTGYHVSEVKIDGFSVGAVNTYVFTAISDNHTIVASFAVNAYSIATKIEGNGLISPSGSTQVNFGDSQTFSITPATGYHVSNVQVDGLSVGAITSYSFVDVVSAHTLSASFAINTYLITVTSGSNGLISPSGSTQVNFGDSQTFSVTPGTGYHVSDVLIDGSSIGPVTSYSFAYVTSAHTISSSFAINTYSITATSDSNGSISPSGVIAVNYGSSQTFNIVANPGYRIADVTVDGSRLQRGSRLHL